MKIIDKYFNGVKDCNIKHVMEKAMNMQKLVFKISVVPRNKGPVENYTDLEADPHVH